MERDDAGAVDAVWLAMTQPLDTEFLAASYARMFNMMIRMRRHADAEWQAARDADAGPERLAA